MDARARNLEEELKRENPKGRLWQACAAQRVAPPQIRHATSGPRHRVEMTLTVGERELASGVHWGWSRKVAEQLAARALLGEFEALSEQAPHPPPPPPAGRHEDEDVFHVEAADIERLRHANPKGQLIEWCQTQKPPVRRPRFESRRGPGGEQWVRARLTTMDLESPWFAASRRKEAEQAAAEGLLRLLPGFDDGAEPEETVHPRSALNELVQQGHLAECDVRIIDSEGPGNAPVFTAEGRARLLDGATVQTEPASGPSKREALLEAAAELLRQVLVELE